MNAQVSKWELKNQDKPASSMTKREMIAAMAMQGLLANEDVIRTNAPRYAVEYADKLLAELDKTK